MRVRGWGERGKVHDNNNNNNKNNNSQKRRRHVMTWLATSWTRLWKKTMTRVWRNLRHRCFASAAPGNP